MALAFMLPPSFVWMLAHMRLLLRSFGTPNGVCLVCPSRTHARNECWCARTPTTTTDEITPFLIFSTTAAAATTPALSPRTCCTHTTVGPQVLGRNCRFLQGPDTDPKAVEKIRKASASASARVRSLCLAAGRYVFAAARHRGRRAGYEPPPPRTTGCVH